MNKYDKKKRLRPETEGVVKKNEGLPNSCFKGSSVQLTVPLCQCQCLQRLSRLCRVILLLLASMRANAAASLSG